MAAHSHQSIFLGVELFAADLCAVMFVAQGERHPLLNELATRPAPPPRNTAYLTLSTMNASATDFQDHFNRRAFSVLLIGLLAYYALWLLCFWPGVLGLDSLGILKEVEDPVVNQSGKTVFWYFFVRFFYSLAQRVEYPIAVQLILGILVFARILTWQWSQQLHKIFVVSLVLVAMTPHMVFFLGTLYPDGIFSVAATGLMFELWLAARQRQLSRLGTMMIALTLPLAVFARANGIIFLLPIFATLFFVPRRSRWILASIATLWIGLNVWGTQTHTSGHTHGAVFPLVIFETVNFLQPRPMNLWTAEPRVAPRTVEILTNHRPLSQILAYYDRDYWDTLIFSPDGPRLLDISRSDQRKLVHDFFRYNLWHNMPDFISSRTHVFLVSALAQGGFPGLDSADKILPLIKSNSAFRPFPLPTAQAVMRQAYEFSFSHRWILWSPLPGVLLLLGLLWRAIWQRNRPLLLLSVPLALQLGGIVFFSIAGEYRYVMPFFTLLPVLLSAWELSRRETAPATQLNSELD